MTTLDAEYFVRALTRETDKKLKPVMLHDYVADVALRGGHSPNRNEAQELVEPLLASIRIRLIEERNVAEQEGVSWHIELYGSENEWIRGSSFNDLSLGEIEQAVRARRAFTDEMLSEVHNLKPTEFEQLSTKVLALLGCRDSFTSPASDDGGIDFYGRLALQGRMDSKLPLGGIDARVNVWLLGQSKHYPTRAIQTSVVRELVGSAELARTKGAIHDWPGLEVKPFDALLLLVFTTGWFSAGSKKLLAKSGVLSMDGRQLATFLCDAGLGFDYGKSTFEPDRFRRELNLEI